MDFISIDPRPLHVSGGLPVEGSTNFGACITIYTIHPKMHTISSTVAVSQPNPRTMWFGKPIDPIGLTMRIYLFIYLLHLFTQGKPKQLTLVFIGALHSFHIVTNMYAQYIIQYSQIARTWRILKHYIYNIIKAGLQGNVNTRFYEVHVWTRSNKLLFVIVDVSRSTWLHHSQQNSWRSNSFLQKEWSVPYESIVSFHEYV